MPKKRLSEEAYKEALESFVVVCADVLFTDGENPKTILLASRRAKPMRGWWFVGGRIYAGEPAEEAMVRLMKRETGLVLPQERFKLIGLNRYFFSERQQEPQTLGCDSLSYVFTAELSPAERDTAAKNLDPKEYDPAEGLRAFSSADALKAAGASPPVIDLYELLYP